MLCTESFKNREGVKKLSFGYLGPLAKFQNHSLSPSGLFLVNVRRRIIKASLATTEVSAGG